MRRCYESYDVHNVHTVRTVHTVHITYNMQSVHLVHTVLSVYNTVLQILDYCILWLIKYTILIYFGPQNMKIILNFWSAFVFKIKELSMLYVQ